MRPQFLLVFTFCLLATRALWAQESWQLTITETVRPDSVQLQKLDSLYPRIAARVDEKKLARGWGKLKKSMVEKDVQSLLGSPAGIDYQAGDNSITWYYGKRFVIFDSIKHKLRTWSD